MPRLYQPPSLYRLTRYQVRAARAMLDWSTVDLARAARVSVSTIRRFEADGDQSIPLVALAMMQEAIERAGVRFLTDDGNGPGVRLPQR